MKLTATQRVKNTIYGHEVDRLPLCFWHHFPKVTSGKELAGETITFFVKKFNLDIVKIMPDLPYPYINNSINTIDQIKNIPALTLHTPAFQEQLTCIKLLRETLGDNYPIVLTLFGPLSYIIRFAGIQRAVTMAREYPKEFLEGVNTVTENISLLIHEAIQCGADGIFYSAMGATSRDFTREEYATFGRPFDIRALTHAKNGFLNVLHIHAAVDQVGDELYFDAFTDYPVSVISWSDSITGPSIKTARQVTDKCLMGGLSERGPLTTGPISAIEREIDSAIRQSEGKKFILGNGCSIPNDTPEKYLHAATNFVQRTGLRAKKNTANE